MVYTEFMAKTPHLTIRLTEEDRTGLERLAKSLGDISLAAVIRHLIRQALGRLDALTPRHAFRVARDFGLPGDEPDGVRWHQCAWSQCPNVVNEEGCICPLHGVKP